MKNPLLAFFFLGPICAYTPAQCGVKCGSERWAVKTASDTTTNKIEPAILQKTVDSLVHTTAPTGTKPEKARISGLEWRKIEVTAILVGYRKETKDHDLHVVIADRNKPSETMIVEFPDNACKGVCSSQFGNEIKTARAAFLASAFIATTGQPTTGFKRLKSKVIVTVVGLGFWDFSHHQTGRAPNDIELHPVISFKVIS